MSLNHYPEYSALSYCWGDPSDYRLISLHGYDKEVSFLYYFTYIEFSRLPMFLRRRILGKYDCEENALIKSR